MFCREQAARVAEKQAEFEALGAQVAAIGNGTPAMARDFAEQFAIDFPLFTDPSRESFRVAGMRRAFGIGVGSIALARRAMAAGHRQGRTAGDPWQQGGLLLVDRAQGVLWSHADTAAGTHGDLAEPLRVLREARAER